MAPVTSQKQPKHDGIVNENAKKPQHDESSEECEYCGGTDGEHHMVRQMGYVWPGEPHMADIDEVQCPNDIADPDEE